MAPRTAFDKTNTVVTGTFSGTVSNRNRTSHIDTGICSFFRLSVQQQKLGNKTNSKIRLKRIESETRSCLPKMSKILTARILFIFCLAFVAGGLGYAAHRFLSQSEQELAESQFHSIAERALNSARAITFRKRMGAVSLAGIFSNLHPDAADWPNVALDGFNEVASDISSTSDGRGMGFMPIVYPEKLQAFEDFAYGYFQTKQRPPFEDLAASLPHSSFGRGVYGIDTSLNTSDNRYHSNGNTSWGGQNHFMAPFFHCAAPSGSICDTILLFDHYSREDRGRFVDDIKFCSDERRQSADWSKVR